MTEAWDSAVDGAEVRRKGGIAWAMVRVAAIEQGAAEIERLRTALADAERDRDEVEAMMDRALRAQLDQPAAPRESGEVADG